MRIQTERRDEAAASAFIARTIKGRHRHEGREPRRLAEHQLAARLQGWYWLIEILQVTYLNNMIRQDHRFIKKLTRPMKGFKSFQPASATLDGIEVAHMIRKHQFPANGPSALQQFAA